MLARMNNFRCWVEETRADVLFSYYESLLKRSGFTIVDTCTTFFNPHGFTALFLLSESHLAIHTFPARGKSYIELTSCVEEQYRRFVHMHDIKLSQSD